MYLFSGIYFFLRVLEKGAGQGKCVRGGGVGYPKVNMVPLNVHWTLRAYPFLLLTSTTICELNYLEH